MDLIPAPFDIRETGALNRASPDRLSDLSDRRSSLSAENSRRRREFSADGESGAREENVDWFAAFSDEYGILVKKEG